ncbi:MAG: hypothetical protein FJW30_00025 [Acidobacteria bacterium]|nr:hypothetical protein [Acidobacteriota bacterium]
MRLAVSLLAVASAFAQFAPLQLPSYDMFRYATAGRNFSYRFAPTGGAAPYRYSVQSGTELPPGLRLDASTGELAGLIVQPGEYRHGICVADAARATICVPFLVIVVRNEGETYTELVPARVNSQYQNLIARPGEFQTVEYDPASGRLPVGLILETTGRLYGIPQAPGGASAFRVRAREADGETVTRNYVIRVLGPLVASVQLPNGFSGVPYSVTPTLIGDAPPHTWSVRRGPLPPGFTLSDDGRLSGVTNAANTYPFSLRAADKDGAYHDQEMTLVIEPTPPALEVTNAPLPGGAVGVPYRQQINAAGGRAPYVFRILGALPAGLSIDTGGLISGTPTAAESRTFTVQITDVTGTSAAKTFTITISNLRYTGPAILTLFAQEAGRAVLTPEGGTGPYRWTVIAGTLPTGVALSEDGVLSGTPAAAGQTTATIRLTDGGGRTVEFPLAITVNAPRPAISRNGIVNGASFAGGAIAPGQIVTLFGARLGPATLAPFVLGSDRRIPAALAGVRVLIGGIAAPLLYVSDTQIGLIVPYDIAGRSRVDAVVDYNGSRSAAIDINAAATAPGLFTADASGRGMAAALNQDGSVHSRTNPARAGSVAVLFGTGEGRGLPAVADGSLQGTDTSRAVLPVRVTVGGREAQVLYAGGAPGLVSGLLQLNIRLAEDTPAGDQPVVLTIGDASSAATATLAVVR